MCIRDRIITDHGTQFKGRKWRDTLLSLGVHTYKTSVYHPSSNPAERVLRAVSYTHLTKEAVHTSKIIVRPTYYNKCERKQSIFESENGRENGGNK